MEPKLIIVEDHPIVAEALTLLIRSAIPTALTRYVSSFSEAKLLLASDAHFDLMLLDLWLPDVHGFEALIQLRKQFNKIPVVIVSAFDDPAIVKKAKVCGAVGFISKGASRDVIVQALRDVLSGGYSFPFLRDGSPIDTLTERLETLTSQQLRVLQMLCRGKLNKQIAFELAINETTVKAHVSEILRKLSVASRTQAVLEVSKLDFRAVRALYKKGAKAPKTSQTPRRAR